MDREKYMQPVATPIRRWELAALGAILVLAAALRLGAPGITEFKRDEANLSQLALDLAHGRNFPWLGISSSVGVPNPPLNVYLFAIPYALSDSPILATLFVGALNVIAVGLAWVVARRYYGPPAAAVAALLYAASPWAVIYSRKIWAQDLLPPFVMATVLTGLLGYGEGKRWARWLHWPLLAITVQLHYGAFTLVPLSLLMVGLWGRRVQWRSLAAGLIFAALTAIPVLIGAYQADLLSLDTLHKGLDQPSERGKPVSTTALDDAWFTVAGTNIHSLAGPEQFQNYLASVPDAYPLFKLIPVGTTLAAVWLAWRAVRQRRVRSSPDAVLVAWLVLPVLAFTWEWTEVAPHYMIPLLPAAYILCGVGFAALWEGAKTPRIRRAVLAGGAVIAVAAALQVLLLARLLVFLDTHDTPGGFGTPLHTLLAIRSAVLEQNPQDVIVVSGEERAPYDEIPAVWGVLLDRVPNVRFVNGTQTAVEPAAPALELIARLPDSPVYQTCAARDCGERAGDNRIFRLRAADSSYVLRPILPGRWAADMVMQTVRFANGASLTGYAVHDNGVLLEWRLSGPVSEDYQAFVHLLDANGQKIAQADRPAWPGRYWRAGDMLYLWFDVVVPPEAETLYAGMYTLDGTQARNVEVLDAQGAYLAQGVEIPLRN